MADPGERIDVAERTCAIDGCERPVKARGWCGACYHRWSRYGDPLGVGSKGRGTLEERFWRYVPADKSDTECWEWLGTRTSRGYGKINRGGPKSPILGAHRASWELHRGPIPTGMLILHSCDNPPCVNPAHLRLGTAAENTADMVAKRRNPRGERHPNATISDAQVAQIRQRYAAGEESIAGIARSLGLNGRSVWAILRGRTRLGDD